MKRDYRIDIVKGIGIFLVVLAHAGCPISKYINLFHMALFFIAAGYCYNVSYSKDLSSLFNLVKKRMKSLYIPYVLYMTVFVIFHNLFFTLFIYTNNPNFSNGVLGNTYGVLQKYTVIEELKNLVKTWLFSSSEQLGGAAWFVKVLFVITILWAILLFIFKNQHFKNKLLIISLVSCLMLVFGYFLNVKNITLKFGLSSVCTCFFMFSVGCLFRIYYKKISNFLYGSLYKSILCIIGNIFILFWVGHYEHVAIAVNKYNNPLLLIIVSISGWFLIWSIAELLNNFTWNQKIVYIGQHTLPILFLQFLAFKLVTLIQIQIFHLDSYHLASFPTYRTDSGWWILYTFAGITVPLLTEYIFRMFIHILKIKRKAKK